MNHRTAITTIALLVACARAAAQEAPAVQLRFVSDTVHAIAGETFSNKVEVRNNSNHTVTLQRTASSGTTKTLIGLPEQLTLAPYSRQSYPVKYLASAQTSALSDIEVEYTTKEPVKVAGAAKFYVRQRQTEHISIASPEPIYYLDLRTGQVELQVKCSNLGNTDVQITLQPQSMPAGLSFAPAAQTFSLAPGQEIWMRCFARYTGNSSYIPDFNVNLQVLNGSGQVSAQQMIKVVALSSNKTFAPAYDNGATLNHAVQLGTVINNNLPSFYRLRANGSVRINENRSTLDYNANLNYYTPSPTNLSGVELYDTRLTLNNRNWGAQLGNIYENLDYTLFGRGASLRINTDTGRAVNLYYVQSRYTLYSDVNPPLATPDTWAASYTVNDNPNRQSKWALLYNTNPLTGIQTGLMSGQMRIIMRGQQTLELVAGASIERSNTGNGATQPGAGGGFNYNSRLRKWELALNNYISTGYYSGIRRGVLLLDDRITRHLSSSTQVFARFSTVNSDPRFLNELQTAGRMYNKLLTAEAGVNTRIRQHFTLGIRPYFQQQNAASITVQAPALMYAARFAVDGRLIFNRHSFSFTSDQGYLFVNNNNAGWTQQPSHRLTANYNYGSFGFNVFAQTGPYYITEIYPTAGNTTYRYYSMGPSLQTQALKGRLDINLGTQVGYYSYSTGWSYSANGQLQYHAGHGWDASAQVIASQFNQFSNMQTLLNVTKRFGHKKSSTQKRMKINLFGDANSNGVKDENEKWLQGIIVETGGATAISNTKGELSFKNVPVGNISLQVLPGSLWSHNQPVQVSLHKNTSVTVPLVKSGKITGSIVPAYEKYQQKGFNLEGIRVQVTDEQGHLYSTLSDENGNFVFSLPENKYTVFIDDAGQPFQITNPKQEIKVSQDKSTPMTFTLTDHSRKVDVKKF